MKNSSYKTIAKTTGLIGAVQIFQMLFGLIRNKVLALAVGTEGFGIWGLYNVYVEMMSQVSILGLDQSGVRQIAKNAQDHDKVSKSVFVLRWTVFIFSLAIAIISMLLSKVISSAIFKTSDYFIGVMIVSLAILFGGIYRGQSSILNGLGFVKELAMSQIIGAVSGSLIAVFLVYYWKTNGIALYVLSVPLIAAITTTFFVRRAGVKSLIPKLGEAKEELNALFSIGFAFSTVAVISAAMTYFSRIYLINTFNLETVGIYQGSWTISNLYIGTILTAMSVDLMPRLMKVTGDDSGINRLVNEQMELGLLVATVGVVGILVFSPLLLTVLYSDEFLKGATIIRWQVLGVSLRVLAFPFSYAIMAKGKTRVFITIQSIFWVSEYLLLILFSRLFGFDGLGVNYLIGYLLYFTMTLFVCRNLFNFRFSILLREIIFFAYAFIGVTFFICLILPPAYSIALGVVILSIQICWINYQLKTKMDINMISILKKKTIGLF